MLTKALFFLLVSSPIWGSPLTDLVDRYGLSGGNISIMPEASVEMPDGVFVARFELLRFGPSPFSMTLHLEYRDGSVGKTILAPGWRLAANPVDGLVAGWGVELDAGDRVVSRYDNAGNRIEYSYTGDGQPASIINQAGQGWRYEYNDEGLLSRIVGSDQRVFEVKRNAKNSLAEVTTYQGAWRFEYGDNLRIERLQGQDGKWTSIRLDELGRVINSSGVDRFTFIYSDSENARQVVMRRGIEPTRTFRFDPNHRWVTGEIEDGPSVTSRMDSNGQLTEISDSSGRSERYKYDNRLRLTEIIEADGAITKITNGKQGSEQIVGPTGLITVIKYDEEGRVVSSKDGNRESRKSYDGQGRLSAKQNPAGGTESYSYSTKGHLGESIGSDKQPLTNQYDKQGRLERITKGVVTTDLKHRPDNRLESVNVNGTTFTQYNYHPAGELKSVEHEGVERRYKWDDKSRLLEIQEGSDGLVKFQYDQSGKLAGYQLGNSTASQFWYNRKGLLELKDLGATRKTFSYDKLGRISEVRNGRGQKIAYEYDQADRLIHVVADDSTYADLAYGPGGKTRRITSPTAEQTTERNQYGNPVSINDKRFSSPVAIQFANDDRISRISYGGTTTQYQHEPSGLLKSILLPGGENIQFENHNGKRTLTKLPNGVRIEYARDRSGRTDGITLKSADGTVLDQIHYKFDAYGRVLAEKNRWQVQRDDRGQLSQFNPASNNPEIYRYDLQGNLLSAANAQFEYDSLNRLTKGRNESFVYDADGNLERRSGDNRIKYQWDAMNRLVAVKGSPFGDVSYMYDALGRRIGKSINGNQTNYFWLDDHVLFQTDEHGHISRQFFYGQRVDEVLAINIEGDTYFPVQDGLGDIRWLIDMSGRLIATFRFGPWGELLEGNPEWLARVGLGYRSRDYDVETGFYYMRARYYAPSLKRFISIDPEDGELEKPLSFNPYLYALNAPLDYVDPYGTSSETPLDWAGRQIGEGTYAVWRGASWAGGKAYSAAHAVFEPMVAIKQGKFKEKYIDKWRKSAQGTVEKGLDAAGGFTSYREGIEDDPERLETSQADQLRRLNQLQGFVKSVGGKFSPATQRIYEAAEIASNPDTRQALQDAASWVAKNTEALAQGLIDIPKNATKAQIKNAILGAIKGNKTLKGQLGNLGVRSGMAVDAALDKFADKMTGEMVKHPLAPVEGTVKTQKVPQNVQQMQQAYNQQEARLAVLQAKANSVKGDMDKVRTEAERAKSFAAKVAASTAQVNAAAGLYGAMKSVCAEVMASVQIANTAADNAERYEAQVQRGIAGGQAMAANCKDATTANKISELYSLSEKLAAGVGLQTAKASVAADRVQAGLAKIQAANQKIAAARSLLAEMKTDATNAETASSLAVQAAKTATTNHAAFKTAANSLVGSIDRVAKGVPEDRKQLKNRFTGLLSRAQAIANSVADTSAGDVQGARVAANNAITMEAAASTKLPEASIDCPYSVPDDAVARAEAAYTGALISVGAGAGLPQAAASCLSGAQGGGQQTGNGQQSNGNLGGNSGQGSGGGQSNGDNSGQGNGGQQNTGDSSGGDSGGGDDFDDFDASTDPGMGSGPTGQQVAESGQSGSQFQTGVPGDGSQSGGRPQGGQAGQQIGSGYTDPGTTSMGTGTEGSSAGGTTGTTTAGTTGSTGTSTTPGQQAGDDWDNFITSGPQVSSTGTAGTTGQSGGSSGTGSTTTSSTSGGSSSGSGGQYSAACNRGDGKIVVTKSFSSSNHISMSSGFASEQEAITWVTNSCSTWRCSKSSGACDTNPSSTSSGVGTYSTGDVTSTYGAVWKRVGCSLGGPHICWGSGGRTMGDGDGDGRVDILLHGSVHWKNVGGSNSPLVK
ncbi:MAG: RHS repeat-associated core domain-containing protein [Sedimenticola sp.]